LAALEARASDNPFCIWEPLILDGQPWNGSSFKHVAWSPNGPKMLRWIVRQVSAKSGHIVSFAGAARTLREQLEEDHRNGIQTHQARRDLIQSLRVGTLRIWAKRDLPRGQANPVAQYEAVDVSLFLDELVSVTEWSTIGPDPELPLAIFKYRGPTFREARLYTADVLRLWPAQQTAGASMEQEITVPVNGNSGASSADDPVVVVIGGQKVEPPPSTLPWAVARIMERLAYPPDRAWNLLHRAMCASELMPRKGKLWAPGRGPGLEQLERDNLHFDFRRYQYDARSGGPVGSLRIGGRSFHPHEITIPAEEVEHWLALQASAHSAGRSTEPLSAQRIVAEGATHEQNDLLRTAESAAEAPRANHLAWVRRQSFSHLARLSRLNERLVQSPEWVNGETLAHWWVRQRGAIISQERTQLYDEACRSIFRAVLAGELTAGGQHPHLVHDGSVSRLLSAGPNEVTGTWFSNGRDVDQLRQYARVLWLPARTVRGWLRTFKMKLPPWLVDLKQPEPAPSGFLYIDVVVDLVQQRLCWSQGRASAGLLDAFASGEIATRRKYSRYGNRHQHFDRENWRGAQVDVEAFQRGHGGGVVVLGREYHLHRFLVHGMDFDSWLRTQSSRRDALDPNSSGVSASPTRPAGMQNERGQGQKPPIALAALTKWYIQRRDAWPAHRKHPSADEDLIAAQAEFPDNFISRDMIRAVRAEHAPAAWTARGRRKLARK
jgi:hypothetical protein